MEKEKNTSGINAPSPASAGGEEVERVICASQVIGRIGVYATMEQIRESALRNNPKLGIHVALTYQSGWFLHWAEGPMRAVNELFERVRHDQRHHHQYVLHRSRGRRLLMTAWSMMLSPSTESSETFGDRVMALRAQMQGGIQYAPTSVIRRLMMPMQLPQALALPDPELYHRVVVCAATGNGAFDLTRWLSERYGVPKASRRHAGETALDSGSDYVDFMHGAYPCRVIAVARSSLNQGLHRSLVPDWRFLVLLFSGEPKRDIALLDLVRETFQGIDSAPEVLAMAPDTLSHDQISRIAQTLGLTCLNAGVMTDGESAAIWQAVDQRLAQADAPHNSVWAVLSGPQAL